MIRIATVLFVLMSIIPSQCPFFVGLYTSLRFDAAHG
jgi:hypothetical protein